MSANGAFSIRFWIISSTFKITFYQLSTVKQKILKSNPTGTPRRTDLDSTLILRPYAEDQIVVNFHVTFTCFFDIILLIEKFTSFPRTFFWRDVDGWKIQVAFTYFYWCDFSGQKKLMLFPLTFFDVILMVEKSTLFSIISSTKLRRAKIRRRFWLNCKLMKTFEDVFLC